MRFDNLDKNLLYRSAVIIASVVIILWGCLVIIKPFIPAILLAIIFCLSTWPAFSWLETRLHNRRTLAATLMTLFLAVCFLVPLVFLGTSLAENFSKLYTGALDVVRQNPGHAPLWVKELPWVGEFLDAQWAKYLKNTEQMTQSLSNIGVPLSQKLIALGASIGRGILDLSLGVLIAFFFFRHGMQAANRTSILIDRFGGPRGQRLLAVSKKTVIGVVYGILGTALAQGALAGLGFWIADIPGAPFLGLLTFLLSFIPMGPPFIWVPAALWLFSENMISEGIFLSIWGFLVISAVDNIIRPYFISLGSNLPLLLVLLGVLGGIIAFGFIGLFIGPTLLALAYTLIIEWSHKDKVDEDKPTIILPA